MVFLIVRLRSQKYASIRFSGDEVSDSEDEPEENSRDKEPKLHAAAIPHIGIVNRLKVNERLSLGVFFFEK